ncbi:hypothetical protein QFC19_009112 [Naganishia cerealis]|uniref:Uncharacterized protein n=1 Tax=Naganishia cerealis TaxID=610337 RepID=A0ACC2UWR8_9TREE|nr:hypothetical protein QFC19_009112 [Naganishia cerealis]
MPPKTRSRISVEQKSKKQVLRPREASSDAMSSNESRIRAPPTKKRRFPSASSEQERGEAVDNGTKGDRDDEDEYHQPSTQSAADERQVGVMENYEGEEDSEEDPELERLKQNPRQPRKSGSKHADTSMARALSNQAKVWHAIQMAKLNLQERGLERVMDMHERWAETNLEALMKDLVYAFQAFGIIQEEDDQPQQEDQTTENRGYISA